MLARSLILFAFLSSTASALGESKSTYRKEAWKQHTIWKGNGWLGAYGYAYAGAVADAQLGYSGAQTRLYAAGTALGKEFSILDFYAYGYSWATEVRSEAYLKLGPKTWQLWSGAKGFQLKWGFETEMDLASTVVYLWGVPVTVGAKSGSGFAANVAVAPDLADPNSADRRNPATPIHLAGKASAWATATLYAGIRFRQWKFEIFLGIEGTARIMETGLGADLYPDWGRFQGVAYLDYNPLSGAIYFVARIRGKIWRWKIRKEWRWTLVTFAGSPHRIPLLDFRF